MALSENYQIHEFDCLKSTLKAVPSRPVMFSGEKVLANYNSKSDCHCFHLTIVLYGRTKKSDEKNKSKQDKQTLAIKFSSSTFASKRSVSTNRLHSPNCAVLVCQIINILLTEELSRSV